MSGKKIKYIINGVHVYTFCSCPCHLQKRISKMLASEQKIRKIYRMRSAVWNSNLFIHLFQYSFIQIFSKYLLRTYCVTGHLQGAKVSEVNKTIVCQSLCPSESPSGSATFQSERSHISRRV